MRRIELLRQNSTGAVDLTTAGGALLVGVEVEKLLDVWDPATGAAALPAHLRRKGEKRTRHARNATGSNNAVQLLAYLAVRDLQARVDFDEATGSLWAITNEADDG